jgi:hypothetical protein
MANPIGITFAPTPDQASMAKQNLSTSGGVPEAIQILSLHLPKFVGARPLAPEALMTPKPTDRVSSVVQSVLRSVGIDPSQAPGSGGVAPSATPAAGSPIIGTPSAVPNESRGLAGLLSSAFENARYDPLPNVTPGVDPLLSAPPSTPPTWAGGDVLKQVDTSRLPKTGDWPMRG